MKYKIYDNGGQTVDRYTLLMFPGDGVIDCVCLSDDPGHYMGVNMYGGRLSLVQALIIAETDKRVQLESLPQSVQNAINERLKPDEQA